MHGSGPLLDSSEEPIHASVRGNRVYRRRAVTMTRSLIHKT